ncbi:MAG: hypothetical protein HY809_02220 [Nitrospirae bacterium]|nr:hypothetical protein [Nitrospirota bacterium]
MRQTINKSSIESLLGIPFTENNNIELLESGSRVFESILKNMSNAKKIICVEFYIFKDDETGRKLAELLKEKAMSGVSVYVLYDHFGSFLTSRGFWAGLSGAGIKFKASHPFKFSAPRSYIYRDHKKLIVIDGTKAFTGGFNIADEYRGYFRKKIIPWRDLGISMEGPIAAELFSRFIESWKRWKGKALAEDYNPPDIARGVSAIPIFSSSARERRRMRKLFIQSIDSSKQSILITTPYFLPGRKILKALERASMNGVDLKILLPGKSDVKTVYYASRVYYKKLLKAGAGIYNYQGDILHAKYSVFDAWWSIVGSANLDFQSLSRNEESNVGILDIDFGTKMAETFRNDLRNSLKIDNDSWDGRPFSQKILERLSFILMKILSV